MSIKIQFLVSEQNRIATFSFPGSGIVNRYIATQGPLASTCGDFWFMTWESQSNLVIMLTTIVERGRVKCHKYWPNLDEELQLEDGDEGDSSLRVRCTREDDRENFAFRDFELVRRTVKKKKRSSSGSEGEEEEEESEVQEETRHVTQMAYLSWPDHGVPDSPDEFVGFVEEVRRLRQGDSIAPTVVHCSAGIGRTGVLILMETALCLVEANQPVYPLDLTRQMRDQRASMIQTPSQYRFVCEAILKVYREGRVKPMPEFCVAAAGAAAGGSRGNTPPEQQRHLGAVGGGSPLSLAAAAVSSSHCGGTESPSSSCSLGSSATNSSGGGGNVGTKGARPAVPK